MVKILKRILLQLAAGANIMAALMLFVCGLSSGLNPANHPYVALFGLGFPLLLLLNLAFILFWLIFHVRYIWLPFAGMLFSASYIYDYCPLNFPKDKPEDTIKLLTYNTEFFGQGKKNENGVYVIVDYLVHSDADIICIQESKIHPPSAMKTVDKAMADAGYSIRHLQHRESEFLLVYSRLPILSLHEIPYESTTNGSIALELLHGEDTVLLVNNHLESYKLTVEDKLKYKEMIKDPEHNYKEGDSKKLLRKMAVASRLRGPQVDSVLNYIHQAGHEAVIVCGDFNDSPISYSYRRLSSDFTNAFRQSGNGLGVSYNQKGFYFRIDHIFVSDYWQTYGTHVDKTVTWSDHYPMITYLKKREK